MPAVRQRATTHIWPPSAWRRRSLLQATTTWAVWSTTLQDGRAGGIVWMMFSVLCFRQSDQAQFSMASSVALLNSLTLFVTSLHSSDNAWAAMSVSIDPMGVPLDSRWDLNSP